MTYLFIRRVKLLHFPPRKHLFYVIKICVKHWLQSERCYTLPLEECVCETDMEGKSSVVCSLPRPIKYNLSGHNNSCNSCRKCNWPERGRIGYCSVWWRLVKREGWRITHWKWNNVERYYLLQTWFRIEEAGLLGCCTVWLGNCFPTFQKNVPPSSSGLWVVFNVEDDGNTFLRNFGNKLPNYTV
jgi:hypothetical protein